MLCGDGRNRGVMIKDKPSMRIGMITHDREDIFVGILRRYKESRILDAYEEIKSANEANGTELRLIGIETAHIMLLNQDYSQFFTECSPFPTDLFLGHDKPDKELDAEIVVAYGDGQRIVMPTGRYQGSGSRNLALASRDIGHADIKTEGRDVVVDIPDTSLSPIENFPRSMGWFPFSSILPTPEGRAVKAHQDAIYLVRSDGAYIGNACLGVNNKGRANSFIFFNFSPSFDCGIAVEIPKADVGVFESNILILMNQLMEKDDDAPSLQSLVRLYSEKK